MSGLLTRLDEVAPEPLRLAIAARREALTLWRKLAALRVDAPVPAAPLFAPFDTAARDRVQRAFEALEFKSLIVRLDKIAV